MIIQHLFAPHKSAFWLGGGVAPLFIGDKSVSTIVQKSLPCNAQLLLILLLASLPMLYVLLPHYYFQIFQF